MKISISVIILSLLATHVLADWQLQETGTMARLNDICFVDTVNGWTCGEDVILRTTDGGNTWMKDTFSVDFVEIIFTDRKHGWVRDSGGILRTTDGGINWIDVSLPEPCWDMDFVDSLHGWSVMWPAGAACTLYCTVDGGNVWRKIHTFTPHLWYTLYFSTFTFIDTMNGWFFYLEHEFTGEGHCCDYPYVYGTSDGGETWEFLSNGIYPKPRMVEFIDTLYGWALDISWYPAVCRTSDGGKNWERICKDWPHVPCSPEFNDMDFVDTVTGWAVGQQGMIMSTVDGTTWVDETSGTSNDLYGVSFVDKDHGRACGDSGTILKYTKAVGIEESRPNIVGYLKLSPIPCRSNLIIEYSLLVDEWVEISIYNVLGACVKQLVNAYQSQGTHKVIWNVKAGLSSGVYFCKLHTSRCSKTEKFILVKITQ